MDQPIPARPPATEWVVAPRAPAEFLGALADLPPLVAQVLHARGCTTPDGVRGFLAAESSAGDPGRLPDMPRAVARIAQAIAGGESIAVYGDYDCDGVTACALVCLALAQLGARARCYIPNRFEEGYGLNAGALDALKQEQVSLVITVDCGGRAVEEAAHARDIGLDLIITDHHELQAGALPDALAVINPRRPDAAGGFPHLAGVGVAYRLVQALLASPLTRDWAGGRAAETADALLDLVAIGTVADVVPLVGENRALVRDGLARINRAPRLGVARLMEAARVRPGTANAATIGFALGPRLNAAGRLDTALNAYDLLMAEEDTWAAELAHKLDASNAQRQQLTAAVARAAEQAALEDAAGGELPPLLFAASESFGAGVIGLAAARLVERHYRPAIVACIANGEARGSCRSVDGFHITAALDECRSLLSRHGGHAAAAGFTTRADQVSELRNHLQAIAARQQPDGGWKRAIHADAEVHLARLTPQTHAQLQQLEPHGMGNPRPIFIARRAEVTRSGRVGRVEGTQSPAHLQLRLRDARRATWDAIAFRQGDRIDECPAGAIIDVAFQLDLNEWNGQQRLQLVVLDFRHADTVVA